MPRFSGYEPNWKILKTRNFVPRDLTSRSMLWVEVEGGMCSQRTGIAISIDTINILGRYE